MQISRFGCGDFQFKTEDSTIICARSMEFPMPMDSAIQVYPRDKEYTSRAPDNKTGLKWKSIYGFVGFTVFKEKGPVEGMNQAGLSFGALSLDCSQYQTVNEEQESQALALMDLGSWILGNFATTEEVKEAILKVRVWGEEVVELQSVPGLHFALHDSLGNNLVIEYINGEAKMYGNPLGVLTNDPVFDWHLQNLELYTSLTPEPSKEVGSAMSLGGGMTGLPGNSSSVSRFVRIATVLRTTLQSEVKPKTALEGMILAEHILNTVDIPKGLVIAKLKGTKLYETTHWCTIKDLANKTLFYRSYNDSTLRKIDFNRSTFINTVQYGNLQPAAESPTIIDVSNQLFNLQLF